MRLTFTMGTLAGLAISISSCNANREGAASPFPATKKMPVTDEYYGVKVTDDYRWLDDLRDPDVRQWNDEQNRYSRAVLDRAPARQMIADRLKEIYSDQTTSYYAVQWRQALFAMKRQPPKEQPFLVVLKSADDVASERVVVDPNQINAKGTTAIDFYVPSLDGRLVAVSLSENGSEDGSVHVFEVATGKPLPDVVPRVQFPTRAATWPGTKMRPASTTPATLRAMSVLLRTPISTSKSTFTSSVRPRVPTLTSSARIFRASRKLS